MSTNRIPERIKWEWQYIYEVIIRPMLYCGSETKALTKQKILNPFERKVLRRIFRYKKELYEIYYEPKVSTMIQL